MLIFLKRHPSNVLDVAIVLSIKGKRAVLHQKKKKPYPQRRVRFPLRTVWANKVVLHVQPGSVWRANVCCKAVQSVVIVVRPRLKQFLSTGHRDNAGIVFWSSDGPVALPVSANAVRDFRDRRSSTVCMHTDWVLAGLRIWLQQRRQEQQRPEERTRCPHT